MGALCNKIMNEDKDEVMSTNVKGVYAFKSSVNISQI